MKGKGADQGGVAAPERVASKIIMGLGYHALMLRCNIEICRLIGSRQNEPTLRTGNNGSIAVERRAAASMRKKFTSVCTHLT